MKRQQKTLSQCQFDFFFKSVPYEDNIIKHMPKNACKKSKTKKKTCEMVKIILIVRGFSVHMVSVIRTTTQFHLHSWSQEIK